MSARRWYLEDATHVRWPGAQRWRGVTAALCGRGYSTSDEAAMRGHAIAVAYAAKHGMGGPDLRVKEARP